MVLAVWIGVGLVIAALIGLGGVTIRLWRDVRALRRVVRAARTRLTSAPGPRRAVITRRTRPTGLP